MPGSRDPVWPGAPLSYVPDRIVEPLQGCVWRTTALRVWITKSDLP